MSYSLNAFLHTPLSCLKGVGPKKAEAFKRIDCLSYADLLLLMPIRYIQRFSDKKLYHAQEGQDVIVNIEVLGIKELRSNRPLHISCMADDAMFDVVYFRHPGDAVLQFFKEGAKLAIAGQVKRYGSAITIPHPEYIVPHYDIASIPEIEPVYPSTYALYNKFTWSMIARLIDSLSSCSEVLSDEIINKYKFAEFIASLNAIHRPKSAYNMGEIDLAQKRLAFMEMLAYQIRLKTFKNSVKVKEKHPKIFSGELASQMISQLPFRLTEAQERVIAQMGEDQGSHHKAFRLIQGDVGSGKTVVALIAALNAIEAGFQAAIMVPTEILAKQHFGNISNLCKGLKIGLLIGSLTAKNKKEMKELIQAGEIDLVIGTHALFQQDVNFVKLGCIIIDEQHRFGVQQRKELARKGGDDADVFLMSATPIPRTYEMVLYADMDVSTIDQKPEGRKNIITSSLSQSNIDALIEKIAGKISLGEKIYWVCPIIQESEKIDLQDLMNRYSYLEKAFPNQVTYIHGKMSEEEKTLHFNQIIEGGKSVLVATSVIEVGVDIKEATVMIIEHPERFGLSQLHQLRGRVGRNDKQSYCILLYGKAISANIVKRLNIMKQTNDGFVIAQEDYKMRGGGDVVGSVQSGFPKFKIFDLERHENLIEDAVEQSQLYIDSKREKEISLLQALF